jgi:hypothetical protein
MNMKVNLVVYLLITVICLVPVSSLENTIQRYGEYDAAVNIDSLDGGWLEELDDVKILHLSGSYYDMGYQHGFLLSDEIGEVMRAQLVLFQNAGYTFEKLVEVWDIMNDYLPIEYHEEMQGMADGAGMPFEEVAVLCMIPAVFNVPFNDACCEISLWGNATADGKLIHIRSWDWGMQISDPETGKLLQENIILIIRNPIVGYASVIPEFPGAICCWHGINEKGIAVGENTCVTWDTTFNGISPAFRMRMVMDSAATAEEAITILTADRTCGTNFVLSDANVPIGYALDQSANISYVGTWNNPVEGTDPFWQIEDAVRRTPMYIDPACAAIELGRIRYDPSGLRGVLDALLGVSYAVYPWIHYRALSHQIEKYYGALDVNSSITALREEYMGVTDFWMFLSKEGWQCLYQWVACPETGDMVISFASPEARACYEPVHYFNLYKLLEAEPPP